MQIAIIEDSALFRMLLHDQLTARGHEIIFCDGSRDKALAFLPHSNPDLVLLDLHLGKDSGLDLGISLSGTLTSTHFVIFSDFIVPGALAAIPQNSRDRWSYLLKKYIRDVDHLDAHLQLALERPVVDSLVLSGHTSFRFECLSEVQLAVLRGIAEGMANESIAETLCLSVKTVEAHCTKIYQNLSVPTDDNAHRRIKAASLYWSYRSFGYEV
jgi:DNA-binding NarL/FixJ family response regulator